LFFDSADPLAADIATPTREETVDGRTQAVGVENVYEYEPAGVGSCATASPAGCVALVSSGSSAKESAFLEATPSGDDVFFLTAAQLLGQDTDDAFDIYDARVCTSSSPCLTPPHPPVPQCASSEGCQGPGPAAAPSLAGGGTSTFAGPGNPLGAPPAQELQSVAATKSPKATKVSTQAQKLRAALLACRKNNAHSKKRRLACEAHARRLYAARPARRGAKRARRVAAPTRPAAQTTAPARRTRR
jgi:hypothetical protein